TLWQGQLYASGPFGSTSVYAPETGKLLSTFPGIVVGNDEQLLYLSLGHVPISVGNDGSVYTANRPFARLPLVARDAHGTQVWTYPAGEGDEGATEIYQLQRSADLVYVLLFDRVVALDEADGSVRWSFPYDNSSSPLLPQRFVIAQQRL